jgi:ABC-type branched-subunit amino acid transport system substrate-binding protein
MADANLHLGVLVPTAKSWPEGRASIGAIALAIDAINAQGGLGGGKQLVYSWAEVDCDRFQAGAALTRMLDEGPVDAVIGPDCSLACESTAYITAVRDIPQISYSCSSSALSDKSQFPTVRLPFPHQSSGRCAWCQFVCLAVRAHDIKLHELGACDCRLCDVGQVDAACRHLER